jgi:hypothetical protein
MIGRNGGEFPATVAGEMQRAGTEWYSVPALVSPLRRKDMRKRNASQKPTQSATARCHWLQVPFLPGPEFPQGLPGLLWIEAETQRGVVGEVYMLSPLTDRADGGKLVGWRLTKSDGTRYDVEGHYFVCDCPDSTFRKRPCKHVKALRAALRSIGVHVPAETLVETGRPFVPGRDDEPPVCGSLNNRHFDEPPGGPDRAA